MSHSNEYKNLKLTDLNLLSGSSETFRTAVDHCWSQISSSTGLHLSFQANPNAELISFDNIRPNVSDTPLIEPISTETILPNYRFPLRLVGDPTVIKNDNFWRSFLLGGTFGTASLTPVFNTDTFDDHMFTYHLPYSALESKNLDQVEASGRNPITISYKYNSYLQEYENYIADLESPLQIPNAYFLEMAAGTSTVDPASALQDIDKNIVDFITLNDSITNSELESLFVPVDTDILPSHVIGAADYDSTTGYKDKTKNINTYLSNYVSVHTPSLSVEQKLQNIFFDNDVMFNTFDTADIFSADGISKFPFYIEIDMPTANAWDQQSTYIRDSITDNNFSPRFLKMIKEIFSDATTAPTPSPLDFSVEASYQSGSIKGSAIIRNEIETVSTYTFRSINLMNSLAYYYNNYLSETENCYFMPVARPLSAATLAGTEASRNATMDTTGKYRYINTISTAKVMKDLLEKIEDDSDYNITSLQDLYEKANDSKYNETIAYRIEKIGGSPTGDSQTQNILQNFWIFNSKGPTENIKFYDSQVKYGEDYTYRVYAYVAVIGHKYNFSDLAITRHIGETGTASNCLEFFNPDTDQSTSQLFDEDALAEVNPLGTSAQVITQSDYLADFYLNYEPTIKLIEIPIYSKTLQISDHSSPALEAVPFQYMDNSQKIGFTLAVDTSRFTKHYPPNDGAKDALPIAITTSDQTLWTNYANSNNILANEEVSTDSVTRIGAIEVYRINEKPTAFSDFANNLLSLIDLRIENTRTTVSKTQFVDKIDTNKKYYYLFRGLSEHNIPTHLSEIYQAELVDDGGYKYSLFDVVYKEDFDTSIHINPINSFKKLFHLKPNLSHLTMDDTNLDYSETARYNLTEDNLIVGTADETIWGKIFKVRLLSKKTGKRIDLNITYNLENE